MRSYRLAATVSALAALLLLAAPALADPCGMVPPIYTGDGPAIQRVGPQKTYVFFKDGIESFVIRPGYSGKVGDFGMLIPFPSVPGIRKVDDNIFTHIANAVDPPEVVVDLRPVPETTSRWSSMPTNSADDGMAERDLRVDEVRVLKEEAVGMYEVVVLGAGSAQALKRWMDDHDYTYPTGMDAACEDYVKLKWCFVAVKTRIAGKSTADPEAGQRDVNPELKPGQSFDGNVQAMGFRFRTPELVVPMRLSSFNEGRTHNVVYLLTDGPSAAKNIPQSQVKRQLSGAELLRNLTSPLPLRILGGTIDDLSDGHKEQLKAQRDPSPHNGLARELFAFDLLASSTGKLVHPHEEREKALLDVSERLNLRGPEVDALHIAEIRKESGEAMKTGVSAIKTMTLTVIDGDFPREVLRKENITFVKYEMPAERNSRYYYHAPTLSEGSGAEPEGRVYQVPVGEGPDAKDQQMGGPSAGCAPGVGNVAIWAIPGAVLLLAALIILARRRRAGVSAAN